MSGFDHAAGGAIHVDGPKEAKKPLVIEGPKNRDWREESRRRRGGVTTELSSGQKLPHEVAAEVYRNAKVPVNGEGDVLNNGPQAFGLTFVAKTNHESTGGDVVMTDAISINNNVTVDNKPPLPKTDDELALEALTGDGKTKRSDLVLPALGVKDAPFTGRVTNGVNEDDAFHTDVESRPESSSLEDYAAVPVEEFGAALLRGMGWKEGDVVGKRKDQVSKARVVERRPALLGIGAKEVPGAAKELGAWGKSLTGKGKKGRKTQEIYTPVVLRDSVTGEMVTEDELREKKEGAKKGEQDWRERRDKNLDRDRERKGEGGGDSKRRREDASSREPSSRRERSRSPRRRRDDDSYRDRRDREHSGRRERDSERYDSSSSKHSRSDGDYRNGHRNRDRDRDRDRDRERDRGGRRDGDSSQFTDDRRRRMERLSIAS